MSPRIEAWVPRGVSEEGIQDLQNRIESLGGRLTSFTEVKPVKPGEISPNALVAFLKDQNPDLRLPETHFNTLLSPLSQFSPEEQKRLLCSFFQEGVENFPNPQEAAKTLVEINNIPFLQPKREPDFPQLQYFVNQFSTRLNESPAPVRIARNNWFIEAQRAKTMEGSAVARTAGKVAEDAARTEALVRIGNETAEGEVRIAVKDALRASEWILTLATPKSTTWSTVDNDTLVFILLAEASSPKSMAKMYIQWVIVGDLMRQTEYNKGNPFKPLIEIYKQGYWPMGKALNDEGQEEFVIFVPPIPKSA